MTVGIESQMQVVKPSFSEFQPVCRFCKRLPDHRSPERECSSPCRYHDPGGQCTFRMPVEWEMVPDPKVAQRNSDGIWKSGCDSVLSVA